MSNHHEIEKLALDKIIALLPGHVYWKNAQGKYLGCNELQAKTLGLKSREEIVNKIPYSDLPQQIANELRESDKNLLETGKPIIKEEVGVRDNGSLGTFLSHKIPLFDSFGRAVGILGVSLDITERKQMEDKIKKLNKSKQIFVENISRIMRAPVSDIIGIVELLKYEKLTKQQQHKLDLIEQSADKITPLLDRITFYSSLEEADVLSTYSPFELNAFFDKKFKLYRDISKSKQIDFVTEINPQIPEWLIGNTHYLSQILEIILDNAVKFTFAGKILIRIDFEKINQENIKLIISVADTGIGIPEKDVKIIFDLFEDDVKEKSEFSSPRVNVSIMKKLVNLMNGELEVSSQVNQGTKLVLTLPFEVIEKPRNNLYPAYHKDNFEIEVKQDAIDLNRELKILILEDDTIQQYVYKEILHKEFNCAIDKAFSLKEVKKYDPKDYDLIFLDMHLPDGKGIDFLRDLPLEVKNTVPVIAVTACATEEEKDAMAQAGITDIVIKPVNVEILRFVVNEYVK